MVCATLLLITILSVASGQATPLYCSDVQSPASGSHNTDLSQVTTLQYCIIDNCTIMRIDTGQQLDIVYTTESLLIVTPIDGHTSMVIAKIDDKLPCNNKYQSIIDVGRLIQFLIILIFGIVLFVMSGYVLTVHLLFKELRSLFGKLLIFYSLGVMSMVTFVLALLLMHDVIAVNSQMICHTTMVCFIMGSATYEVFATNILTHLAYTMYRCYKLKSELSSKASQFLLRCYFAYAFITLVLLFFLVITYDWRTGNGRHTLLPNGHCAFVDQYSYNTLLIAEILPAINKVIQILMFIAYIVYYIKFNAIIGSAEISKHHTKDLFRIAIAMGATLGLSYFVFIFLIFDSEYVDIAIGISGTLFLVIQQCVIMKSFMCTEKMSGRCNNFFSRNN